MLCTIQICMIVLMTLPDRSKLFIRCVCQSSCVFLTTSAKKEYIINSSFFKANVFGKPKMEPLNESDERL